MSEKMVEDVEGSRYGGWISDANLVLCYTALHMAVQHR